MYRYWYLIKTQKIIITTMTTEEITPNPDEDVPTMESSNFNIPVHSLITEAQNSHGLRHNDYAQYRAYLTRRLSRLRHAKTVRKDLTFSSSGYSKSTPDGTPIPPPARGGRHAFHPRSKLTPSIANKHVNFVLVALFNTERAWAHSMELKADYHQALTSSNQKTNLTLSLQRNNASKGKIGSSPGAIRQQYLARLKKATKYANEFEGIAAHVCDEATSLEIKAYTNWILGTWFCETGDWQNACSRLSNSLHICQKLSEITSSSTIEALQLSDFFSSRAKNVIQPLLRYCQYELQQIDGNIQQDPTLLNTDAAVENEYILTKLEAIRQNSLEAEAQKSGSDNSFVISFRGKDLLVDNQYLRVQLLQMDEYKKDLIKSPQSGGKGGDAKFLKHLSCIDDAISIISQELKEYAGLESGPAVNKKRFEFDCLLGYCKYEKLKLMMERNEKMVNELKVTDREHILGSSTSKRSSKKESTTNHTDPDSQYKKVEEIAHLYDALMQDARDVVTLPGLGSFDDSLNTNDDIIEDDFMLEANANLLRIRALRCYYMGRMYASDAVGKYQEAVALYDVASRLASEAAEEIAACPNMERADELIESMVDLESDIVGAKCRADACAYLAKRGSGASSATNGATLLNRIDDFDSGGKTYRLSNVPLTLELVACKPSFFDIANNYVSDFPIEELRGHINAHNTQSRGFLKWFRR